MQSFLRAIRKFILERKICACNYFGSSSIGVLLQFNATSITARHSHVTIPLPNVIPEALRQANKLSVAIG